MICGIGSGASHPHWPDIYINAEELQEFSENVKGKIRFLVGSFKSDDLVSAGLYMMRRLSCHVNIGLLKNDPGAVAETSRNTPFCGCFQQMVNYFREEKSVPGLGRIPPPRAMHEGMAHASIAF